MADTKRGADDGPLESLVVADLGRGTSRAYLLEQVAGAFRFVAKAEGPTTGDRPYEDLTVGWQRLIAQLEWESGRRLGERDGLLMPQQERGDGVDGLIVCATTGEPLRVAVLEAGSSPVTGPLLEGLRRAYTRVFHAVAPSRSKDGAWGVTQAEALRRFRPDTVIVVIGADEGGGAARVAQVARQIGGAPTSSATFSAASPRSSGVARAVVVAEPNHQSAFAGAFGTKIDTRMVAPGEKSAGELASEIERELLDAYRAQMQTADFAEVTRDAVGVPMVRAQAVDLVNRYIARAFGRRVITIGIDDGAHVHWAAGDQTAVSTLPHLDLGPMITGLTAREVADAARWLPFATTEDELISWVLNRAVRPWTAPHDPRDVLIDQAMARQVARRALGDISRSYPLALPGADLVIGGRWFARGADAGSTALALLDSIDVVPDHGVLDLAIDQDGLMAVAGALGAIDPALAADIFEYDGLTHLGSAVVIGGTAHDGDLACRGELQYESGETVSFSVASGQLEVLALRAGETATLVLRPERRFSVGGHPSGKSVTLSDNRRIIGGAVGLIVDARGRSLGFGPAARPAKVKRWLEAVNGVEPTTARRSA